MQLLRKNKWADAWPATCKSYCYSCQPRPLAHMPIWCTTAYITPSIHHSKPERLSSKGTANQAQQGKHIGQHTGDPKTTGSRQIGSVVMCLQGHSPAVWYMAPKTKDQWPGKKAVPLTAHGCRLRSECNRSAATHLDCSARRAAFGVAPALTKMTTTCLARRAAFVAAHHSQQCQHAARLTVPSPSLLLDCE
jgi:hypothetical protein